MLAGGGDGDYLGTVPYQSSIARSSLRYSYRRVPLRDTSSCRGRGPPPARVALYRRPRPALERPQVY
eukprot:scaffold40461_cov18-Prasinocladus_malaysianus.AAC.1